MTSVRQANLIQAIKEAIGLIDEHGAEVIDPKETTAPNENVSHKRPSLAKIKELARRAAMNEALERASKR